METVEHHFTDVAGYKKIYTTKSISLMIFPDASLVSFHMPSYTSGVSLWMCSELISTQKI